MFSQKMKRKPFLFNKSSSAAASKGRLVKKRQKSWGREKWEAEKKWKKVVSEATSTENEKGEAATAVSGDFLSQKLWL